MGASHVRDDRVLRHAGAVALALFLTFALRPAIDGRFTFTLPGIGVASLQALPVALAAVVVAGAALGLYGSSSSVSIADALATAALAVALQQPYAAATGGTALPLLTIPLEIAAITGFLVLSEHPAVNRAQSDRTDPR